jgi:hypothetical protein
LLGLLEYMEGCRKEMWLVLGIVWMSKLLSVVGWTTHSVVITHIRGYHPLPLGGWYPFDLSQPWTYRAILLHQFIAMIQTAMASNGCKMLVLLFAFYISKLLRFYKSCLIDEPPKGVEIAVAIARYGRMQREIFRYEAMLKLEQKERYKKIE